MNTQAHHKRNKLFESIITGKQPISRHNYGIFLEAISSSPNAASCAQRLVSNAVGLPSLQAAMQFDLSPRFMDGPAASVLMFFHRSDLADVGAGHLLRPILKAVVEPGIFWNALKDAFKARSLNHPGEQAFGALLFELVRLPNEDGDGFRAVARDTALLERLLSSSDHITQTLGYKIKNIIAAFDVGDTRDEDDRPGGRHDNDDADFRKIAILPTAGELLSDKPPFLRGSGMLTDPETASNRVGLHLDNQFRLLREDMLYEIREEMQQKDDKKTGQKKRRVLRIDAMKLKGLYFGPEDREDKRCRWGLVFECHEGFLGPQVKNRKTYLEDNHNLMKHQSVACLYADGSVIGFPSIYRDLELLSLRYPQIVLQFLDDKMLKTALKRISTATKIQLTQIDAPIFAYDPVLRALQNKAGIPLSEELLYWSDGAAIPPSPHTLSDVIDALTSTSGRSLQDIIKSSSPLKLDDSQTRSLIMGLSQRVSLIQGPPGTGKSFIGALLTKILYTRTDETILVVCYTNHALDQFIVDLVGTGIPEDRVIRLGGKAAPHLESLTLRKQPPQSTLRRFDRDAINLLKARLNTSANSLRDAYGEYRSSKAPDVILEHLQIMHSDFYAAFQVEKSADGMEVVGKKGKKIKRSHLLQRWMAGRDAGPFKSKANILEAASIWSIPHEGRSRLVSRWEEEILEDLIEMISEHSSSYSALQFLIEKKFAETDLAIIKNKRIIACTTTGAAKYREEVAAARPGILIVEEAGEILESHILTALTPQTNQMILIGDHKQLRPKVNNYLLTVEKGEGFDLNQSLFERLVKRGYPHESLKEQHRMRPEISDFVRQLTYPELLDAPKTLNRPHLRGVDSDIVFIEHSIQEKELENVHESRDSGSKSSKQNEYEADMVWKIVRYLAQQGYRTEEMVVLTPYLGQLRELREKLKYDTDPVLNDLDSFDLIKAGLMTPSAANLTRKPIRLATIDNYQGEESDIVIVSLTRSNPEHNIGFMSSPERVNVLLSRARNALIMIGNAQTFMRSRQGGIMWTKLIDMLKNTNSIFAGLPVHCERHPTRRCLLKSPADFDEHCPDGGCSEKCTATLSCGIHTCPSKCHQISDHSKMKCEVIVYTNCPAGHPLKTRCGAPPKPCSKCEADLKQAEKQRELTHKHDLRLAELDAQIQRERDVIRAAQLSEEREEALRQKEIDLRHAKEAASNANSQGPTQAPPPTLLRAAVSMLKGTVVPQKLQPAATTPSAADPHSAKGQWEQQKCTENAQNESIDAIMSMIGLEEVKKQVMAIKDKIDVATRQNTDLKKERFNIAMLGNPGTGKTTVARHYAKFLSSVHILPSSKFLETTGSRLASEGIPAAEKHLKNLLQDGGGILFIDEAYQLTSAHNPGGASVLDFLLAEMENNVGKLVFILAGYDREMERFWEHNPGLKSRVPYSLRFKDYKDDELLGMLESLIGKQWNGRMRVQDKDDIRGLSGRIAARRLGAMRGQPGFGNARAVENLLSKIRERQAKRLTEERRQGIAADDFLLTRDDLIGPEPSKVQNNCAPWEKLQGMIGLRAVKEALSSLFDLLQTNYQRELLEKAPLVISLNRVFVGNPGTGKTTVAKIYGEILAQLGILTNGEVIVKNPSDFVGDVLGASESQTKAILASTVGKVLVIDEAYMLYAGSTNSQDSFKTAVIDTIVAEVQSVPGEDRCVLLLGYKDKMEAMFQNVNPGLSRRFPMKDAFDFEDYSSDELLQALEWKLKEGDLTATAPAKKVALDVLEKARNRPNFGNIGEVDNILSSAKIAFQKRQRGLPFQQRSPEAPFEPEDFDADYDRLNQASANLPKLFDGMVGSESLIRKLKTWQTVARASKARGKVPRDLIPTSFVFKGPPGTGKTTTARKLGQVYYDMGLLASTDVVECSASDLVGQYVGQTGPKTRSLFEKARGRVLFIDEAYRLSEGHFAKEAMDEIVALMTDEQFKGRMIVVLAGYDNEINELLSKNPGLSSRFPEEVIFTSFTPDRCMGILQQQMAKENVQVAEFRIPTSIEYSRAIKYFQELSQYPSWGNARDVLELWKQMLLRAHSQLPTDQLEELSNEPMELSAADALECFQEKLATFKGREIPKVPPHARPDRVAEWLQQCPSQMPPPLSTFGAASTLVNEARAKTEDSHASIEEVTEDTAVDEREHRDSGVSDAIWTKLQVNKQLMEEEEQRRDAAISSLQEESREVQQKMESSNRKVDELDQKANIAKQSSDIAELMRQREEERLRAHAAAAALATKMAALEAEKQRQREEVRVQKKLREMGLCVAGFRWIKEATGYRCAGGSHFMGNDKLGI